MNATEIIQHISEEAQAQESKRTYRFVRVIKPGQWVRQGDIYIIALSPPVPNKKLLVHKELSDRHHAVGHVVLMQGDTGPLDGPIVVAQERWEVHHPEHGITSIPSGFYEVRYQRDCESEAIKRAND